MLVYVHPKSRVKMNVIFATTEANKLHNIQINLEKSINLILEHLKKYSGHDLEYSTKLFRGRQTEWETLQINIKDILEPLRNKMMLIEDKKLCDINDFKQFKKEMIVIQENIQKLKSEIKIKIKLLEKERSDMSEDLNFFNEKLLQWIEPIKINVRCNINSHKPKTDKNRHLCKEANEYMDFVHMSGGHENGWHRDDHQLFLKFRSKHKTIDIVAQNLHETLPDISISEIKCHEEWYKKYINLQKKKRDAIKAWQKEKNNKPLKFSSISSKIMRTPEIEPELNIQEKLLKWKTEREEKIKSATETENYKQLKRKELEELRKKRNEELKKIVQDWKQTKEIKEQQESLERRTVEEYNAKRRFYRRHQFPGIIGCVDCTHVAIYPPQVDEDVAYVNRKGYHSINVQLICDPDLRILNVCARYPGSSHDSYIWNNSGALHYIQNLHRNGHTSFAFLVPWYVRNADIFRDLEYTPVTEIIRDRAKKLYTLAEEHRNPLIREGTSYDPADAPRHKRPKVQLLDNGAMEANRMIKRFQSLDDSHITKMRQQRKRDVIPQIRSKSSHLAKRDPERLLKPTKQWLNRVHDETYSSELSAIMPLKCLPKLGIPEWRKKLD